MKINSEKVLGYLGNSGENEGDIDLEAGLKVNFAYMPGQPGMQDIQCAKWFPNLC